MSIKLNQKDKILLELFKKDIEAENPVFEERIDKRSKSMMSGIFIVSDKIFNDLGNLNCIPRKTFKIDSIPNGVPYNLISHFIRGYFDGDGSVNFNKDKSLIFQIVGQEEFLIKIKTLIEEETKINLKMYADKRTKGLYALHTGNKQYISRLYAFLYKDATRYLPRKKILFEQFISNIIDHYVLNELVTFNKICKEEII